MVQLDPHPLPPENFSNLKLPITKEKTTYYRLNPAHHNSTIYFDYSSRGRFDSKEASFGIWVVICK